MSLVSAFQIPYREDREGFWGNQTATLNWCEEVSFVIRELSETVPQDTPAHAGPQDYNITYYCAETINTATNLGFIFLGIKGLRDVIKHSHSRAFILAWLGYIVVGLGSTAFHATLKCEDTPFFFPSRLNVLLISS